MIFASFWHKRKRGVGQSPTLKAKPSLAAEAALNAKEALKGYGGKQEFSPGLFLPLAGKDIFLSTFLIS